MMSLGFSVFSSFRELRVLGAQLGFNGLTSFCQAGWKIRFWAECVVWFEVLGLGGLGLRLRFWRLKRKRFWALSKKGSGLRLLFCALCGLIISLSFCQKHVTGIANDNFERAGSEFGLLPRIGGIGHEKEAGEWEDWEESEEWIEFQLSRANMGRQWYGNESFRFIKHGRWGIEAWVFAWVWDQWH